MQDLVAFVQQVSGLQCRLRSAPHSMRVDAAQTTGCVCVSHSSADLSLASSSSAVSTSSGTATLTVAGA